VVDEEQSIVNDEIKTALRQAKSIIVEYLSDAFLFHANNTSTSKEIFAKLDEIYERKSLASQLS